MQDFALFSRINFFGWASGIVPTSIVNLGLALCVDVARGSTVFRFLSICSRNFQAGNLTAVVLAAVSYTWLLLDGDAERTEDDDDSLFSLAVNSAVALPSSVVAVPTDSCRG
jgi:hypothetical protein